MVHTDGAPGTELLPSQTSLRVKLEKRFEGLQNFTHEGTGAVRQVEAPVIAVESASQRSIDDMFLVMRTLKSTDERHLTTWE